MLAELPVWDDKEVGKEETAVLFFFNEARTQPRPKPKLDPVVMGGAKGDEGAAA